MSLFHPAHICPQLLKSQGIVATSNRQLLVAGTPDASQLREVVVSAQKLKFWADYYPK